ncbi:MAG: SAM-dependent methyltransferase [Acidobacteriota bacterium]
MRELEEKILTHITNRGPITFSDFMEMVLYDRDYGYYSVVAERIGPAGDYYTSANVAAEFGALLAQQCLEMRAQLGTERLVIVEIGAGTGQLAFDILTALIAEHHLSAQEIEYLICETSPAMQARQAEKLERFTTQVRWVNYQALASAPIEGVIISNEVVDALPVHRVKWQGRRLRELFVTAAGTGLQTEWYKPSTLQLGAYLQRFDIRLEEGQIAEINLNAIVWLQQVAAALRRGFVITIDYGDLVDHLYAPDHQEGTLRCFYRHTLNDEPLARVGEQDITADVNFSALIDYGQEFGLETVRLARQADYLIRLGLLDRLQHMIENCQEDFTSLKARLALKNFFVPGGISDHFKVLIQQKGLKDS